MEKNTWTIEYCSETLLPAIVRDFFDQTEKELCAISREPDKTVLYIGELRSNITTWLAYHKKGDTNEKTGQ
jgi:hypothetical protein